MIAVITGDIIGSKKIPPASWLGRLKELLEAWGSEPESWEIYRGDSFQLRVDLPERVLEAAIWIKTGIKSIPGLDVRMGIGIGEMEYSSGRITECNGSAFVRSGEVFEDLHKLNQEVAVKSPWVAFDKEVNLSLKLALTIMNQWTVSSSVAVFEMLKEPTMSQASLGAKLGITQHAVSARLSRANFDAIKEWMDYFLQKLHQYYP